jgi:hypothetical protein
MAASIVNQITIPDSAVAAQFTSGEFALPVHSPHSSTPAGTYYLAKNLLLKGGTYTLKMCAVGSASAWIGDELISSRRIVSSQASGQVIEADFFVREGAHRFDVVLSTLGGSCYVVFSIWKAGRAVYTSAGAGWLWDTQYVADSLVPSAGDRRLALPVWSFTPNWKSGVTERLSWKSEILDGEGSTEQRRSLRRNPRRSWEAQFLRTGSQRMRMNDFITGIGNRSFIAPFWPEQLKLQNPLSSGTISAAFSAGTLDFREFVPGQLVLLYGFDPVEYELLIVDSVNATTITFTSQVIKSWGPGTRICPAYEVRFDTIPGLVSVTDRLATSSIRFEQVNTIAHIEPSWGYCAPLWQFILDRKESLQIGFERSAFMLDNDTSPADVVDFAERTRNSVRGSGVLFGKQAASIYRSFLAQARGRTARFWFPSGTHDVEPTGSIGGLTLDVVNTGNEEFIGAPQESRQMLGFYFNNGTPTFYRKVISVERISNSVQRFTFEVPVPPIDRSKVLRVGYVMPVRFDQDTFELHHVSDSATAVKYAAVVKSAEIDGMPPIECFVTSWTYPLEQIDEMLLTTSIQSVQFFELQPYLDTLDLSNIVVNAELVSVLQSYTLENEDRLDLSSSVLSGEIISTLQSYTLENEDRIDLSNSLLSGTLENALISTTMDTDSVDLSNSIISAELV